MSKRLRQIWVLIILSMANGDPELPLCPVNVQYFPQNLPMHCRMPPGLGSGSNQPPGLPSNNGGNNSQPPFPFPPAYDYNSPPPNAMPPPIPFPVPPGFPGPMYPPPPMPLIPGPPAPQKLPVIVMPFYSPDPAFAKKKKNIKKRPLPKKFDSNTDSSDDESCSSSDKSSDSDSSSSSNLDTDGGFWKHRRAMSKSHSKRRKHSKRKHKHHRRSRHMQTRRNLPETQDSEMLTPVIQYVNKNGYVIYEKQISKKEANNWLNVAKEDDKKINFEELDEINKRYPGDGTGDADAAAESERNKKYLDKQFKKVEQELLQEKGQELKTDKPNVPKPNKFRKNRTKSRKEKFAAKIGTNVETLS